MNPVDVQPSNDFASTVVAIAARIYAVRKMQSTNSQTPEQEGAEVGKIAKAIAEAYK